MPLMSHSSQMYSLKMIYLPLEVQIFTGLMMQLETLKTHSPWSEMGNEWCVHVCMSCPFQAFIH